MLFDWIGVASALHRIHNTIIICTIHTRNDIVSQEKKKGAKENLFDFASCASKRGTLHTDLQRRLRGEFLKRQKKKKNSRPAAVALPRTWSRPMPYVGRQ